MSHTKTNLMYVNIPKNASSWTKPNLKDWGWEFYNYHADNLYSKHAIVVLRDPIDRWLSGIAEYMFLYHPNVDLAHLSNSYFELVFDKISFDDHTEKQVLFLEGLDLNNCTFLYCDKNYKMNFSNFLAYNNMPNSYFKYEDQHVTANSKERKKFRDVFENALNSKKTFKNKLEWYFEEDYKLIDSTNFYSTT